MNTVRCAGRLKRRHTSIVSASTALVMFVPPASWSSVRTAMYVSSPLSLAGKKRRRRQRLALPPKPVKEKSSSRRSMGDKADGAFVLLFRTIAKPKTRAALGIAFQREVEGLQVLTAFLGLGARAQDHIDAQLGPAVVHELSGSGGSE